VANRVSYCLDLTGPSVAVDTACSSSMVALDAALKALRCGDCTSALVLAVDLFLDTHRWQTTCAAKMLSPRGRCATFSDQADGYARGEGCGAVVLTLESAEAAAGGGGGAARPAWAHVRATAINQDGRSANLTSPVGPAQEACIELAHRRAGVGAAFGADDVAFLEAHGTGTALGDPQELEALANVFARAGRTAPLPVGAVKSRIGHLEAAAGIAGIIKATLALAHRELPPNLHCAALNPRLERLRRKCDFVFPRDGPLPLASGEPEKNKPSCWPGLAWPGLAGVSCFGFVSAAPTGMPRERSRRSSRCRAASCWAGRGAPPAALSTQAQPAQRAPRRPSSASGSRR
jgi:acyl transferase domain-containing protein